MSLFLIHLHYTWVSSEKLFYIQWWATIVSLWTHKIVSTSGSIRLELIHKTTACAMRKVRLLYAYTPTHTLLFTDINIYLYIYTHTHTQMFTLNKVLELLQEDIQQSHTLLHLLIRTLLKIDFKNFFQKKINSQRRIYFVTSKRLLQIKTTSMRFCITF